MQATQETVFGPVRTVRKRRMRIVVSGAVQGVGFRPFVFRLAKAANLCGTVSNSSFGVVIDVEGDSESLQTFVERVESEHPPLSRIERMEMVEISAVGFVDFEIGPSDVGSENSTYVLPDIAVCDECLAELRDPANRRYRYPFINCTHCGPRFTIIESMPYDRRHTSMKQFRMCRHCRDEYEDPSSRRFHAQPIACADCGPQLALWDTDGNPVGPCLDAVRLAAEALRNGGIVAVKGVGGFHLLVDARNTEAVHKLRARKARPDKPFAVMYPSLERLREDCYVDRVEAALLQSAEAPIVLLRPRTDSAGIARNVAPHSPTLGAMLPYAPLHHLLMDELRMPLVATSGNRSDEPICIDERDALARLHGIPDFYLVHDRPIVRHADDSIVRVVAGRAMILRRARGYAPLPIEIGFGGPDILAVGPHLKNCTAVTKGRNVFLSQHLGDLDNALAYDAFVQSIDEGCRLHGSNPIGIACDHHEEYGSTRHAQALRLPVCKVQHHYAHVLGCMAENGVCGPVLGVSWDGTGLGEEGEIWGGEFMRADYETYHRVAHFREMRLPGGEQAIREPRRTALALLMELFDDIDPIRALAPIEAFDALELRVMLAMLRNKIRAPRAVSVGRLFDAVASILGICHKCSFEGQAAIALEAAATRASEAHTSYRFDLCNEVEAPIIVDWAPVVRGIVDDVVAGVPSAAIALAFHRALAEATVRVAQVVGIRDIVLTGGCFQNALLTEYTVQLLRDAGFQPHWHRFTPPNDGGIALGQAVFAMRQFQLNKTGGPSPCA